jgi:hypothetical protein
MAPIVPPPNPRPPASVDLPIPWGSYDTVWSLRVEPTIAYADVVAEHGDWTIKVTGIGENAEFHAYVARTDPNMNQYTGAKASYFVDPVWERNHSASAGCTWVNGEFPREGSRVERHGTLNGIATAKETPVRVAGGYILSHSRKSPYSSAGPARSGPHALRKGPDYLLPCDESYALGGLRGGGNRSGSVIRLTGTSAAAPQLARWAVRNVALNATHSPVNPVEEEERGYGNLEPP